MSEAWREFLDQHWPGRYEGLMYRARIPWNKDYVSVLERLNAAKEEA